MGVLPVECDRICRRTEPRENRAVLVRPSTQVTLNLRNWDFESFATRLGLPNPGIGKVN